MNKNTYKIIAALVAVLFSFITAGMAGILILILGVVAGFYGKNEIDKKVKKSLSASAQKKLSR